MQETDGGGGWGSALVFSFFSTKSFKPLRFYKIIVILSHKFAVVWQQVTDVKIEPLPFPLQYRKQAIYGSTNQCR